VACRVFVFGFALQQAGHRLEAAVWMIGGAHRLPRRVVDGPHLVEHQERIGEAEPGRREGAANDEAGAFALAVGGDDVNHGAGGGGHGECQSNLGASLR
jgi:hypothetical protein